MKKNILSSLVLIIFLAILTACGSNSKSDPVQAEGPYAFFNATTPLIINAASVDNNGTVIGGIYKIQVQLLEFGLGVSGEIVKMKPFNLKYGFLTYETVITDFNGYATFIYNTPEKFTKIRGEDITIQAVYLDNSGGNSSSSKNSKEVILRQDFVLQFR